MMFRVAALGDVGYMCICSLCIPRGVFLCYEEHSSERIYIHMYTRHTHSFIILREAYNKLELKKQSESE